MQRTWMTATVSVLAVCTVALPIGCVTRSRYNSMLKQQEALETSLRAEISADQVKIEQLEDGIRVRLTDDLLYRSGAVELQPKGRAALDKVAGQLATMAADGNVIDVVGNTDTVPVGRGLAGRYPTNWDLAAARAVIVVRYLQEKGVDPASLTAISQGQYHPIDSNDSSAGRGQNRRTDLLLRPTK